MSIKSRTGAADTVSWIGVAAAMPKYPQSSDVYESLLYPGRSCEVVGVENARVTFRWLGDYAHIEQQVVPVNRFIVDFALLERQAGAHR